MNACNIVSKQTEDASSDGPDFFSADKDGLSVDGVTLIEEVCHQLLLLFINKKKRAAVGVHQVLRVHL